MSPGARRGLVAFVVWDFDPAVGGTTRQTRTQAEVLQAAGHRVVVLTHRFDRAWPPRERVRGLEVRRFGPPGLGIAPKLKTLLALARWLARHRRHVEVVQVVMDPDLVLASGLAGRLGRTVVLWATDGDATRVLGPGAGRLGGPLQRAVRRALLERCQHVALTPAMASELAGLGLPGARVIPVPVDASRFRPPSPDEREAARAGLGLAPDAYVVAYVGHLEARKAVDRLVVAFDRFLREAPEGQLLVVGAGKGEGDAEAQLHRQVAEAELGERVRFTGAVEDVRPALWSADVLVLPSEREGMPNSLLEAMASGVPCVAPPSAGGDAVLANGAGLVPASNEPTVLLEALRQLHGDPHLVARLRRTALARVGNYTPAAVGAAYVALYEALEAAG